MLKRSFQSLMAVIFLMLGVAACTPKSEPALPAEGSQNTTVELSSESPLTNLSAATAAETPTAGEAALDTTLVQPSPGSPMEDTVVDVTPMSEKELSNQPPETSPSGSGESAGGGGGAQPYPGFEGEGEINPSEWLTYTDPTYRFSVAHPADFVVRPLDSAKLAEFTPAPAAVIRFMSLAIANSDLGDLDIPELSLRVFPAPQEGSLENWLSANGLTVEGDRIEPYQNVAMSGVKVCLSTMLAPNCSIFVLGNGWIYQLTPLGPIGEAMVESFALTF